jgi:signal transduction histidine kinase
VADHGRGIPEDKLEAIFERFQQVDWAERGRRAHHLCMGCRGVKLPTTELVTSAMLGTMRNDAVTRAEFLQLCS